MEKYDLIQVRIEPFLKKAIKEYCKKHSISVSVFIRMAIEKAVRDNLPSILDTIESFTELSSQKDTYLKSKSELEILRKDLREMKSLVNSIVNYIKQKELKTIHKELHPRENPKSND